MLVPFHEVYAVRTHESKPTGLLQVSYVVFISQARNDETGALGHFQWFLYTEDPAGVPGKYRDGPAPNRSGADAGDLYAGCRAIVLHSWY
jgi:hypothetical protein